MALYVKKRLDRNGVTQIVNNGRSDVAPSLYVKLQSAPASSAGVERSFSMLKKWLSKDRHFESQNIEKYFSLYNNI